MKSLANLNTYAATSIEVTDSRPAGVKFSGATPIEITTDVASNRMVLTQPLRCDEIINYDTAALKLRFTVKNGATPNIVGTTFTFPSGFVVPTGITVTNIANNYIEISGFKTAEQFNLFTTVNWNLPANYATYTSWWIESKIYWFDAATSTTKSLTWDIFDPDFYRISLMAAVFTVTGLADKLKRAIANMSSSFNLSVPYFVLYDETIDPMNSAFTFTKALATRIKRLFINTMPTTVTMAPVISTRIKPLSSQISGAFSATLKITYAPAGVTILAAAPAQMTVSPVKTTDFQRFEYVYTEMDTDNTRLRHAFDAITFDNVLPFESNIIGIRPRVFDIETNSTFNSQSQLDRIRFSGSSISSNFESTTVASHTKSFISTTSSSFGININPVKTVSALSSSSINANTNTIPTRIKQLASVFQTQTSSLNLSVINTPLLIRVFGEGNPGSQEVFSLMLRAPYDITIEWGDGTKQSFVNTGKNEVTVNKSYPIFAGARNVSIYGSELKGFRVGIVGQIFEVVSWGRLNLQNLSYCFSNSDFNISIPKFIPSTVTRINGMFYKCINFNNENINFWDTSNITDMSYLFYECFDLGFDTDINFSSWNTSNVTNMEYMFYHPNYINGNIGLSGWDTSKVTNMRYMFFNTPFSDNISSWNTSNVTNMDGMFMENIIFDRDISGWCVENIPTKPVNFDTGTSASWTTAEKPVWGTCP